MGGEECGSMGMGSKAVDTKKKCEETTMEPIPRAKSLYNFCLINDI